MPCCITSSVVQVKYLFEVRYFLFTIFISTPNIYYF